MSLHLAIRTAEPSDARALARLAALDSQPLPAGPLLVAEQDGELVAARALESGATIADPFRPTAHALAVLAAAAPGAARPARRRRRLPLALRLRAA